MLKASWWILAASAVGAVLIAGGGATIEAQSGSGCDKQCATSSGPCDFEPGPSNWCYTLCIPGSGCGCQDPPAKICDGEEETFASAAAVSSGVLVNENVAVASANAGPGPSESRMPGCVLEAYVAAVSDGSGTTGGSVASL